MTRPTLPPAPEGAAVDRPWLRFVLPLLALSILIAGLGSVGYRYLSDEIRRETHRTLAVIVEQKRQQIEGWLADARVDTDLSFYGHSQLELLFGKWAGSGRKDTASLKQIQTLMMQMAEARGWAGLALVGADAGPAFVVGDADVRGHEALIEDILRRPRVELVDLHRNADGQVRYGVLAPIGSPDMEPLGVAYVTWRADRALNPLVGAWPVPTQSAETYLVRRDGDQVRFLTPLRFNRDAALALSLPLTTPDMPAARAARGERGIIAGGRDYRRAPVLAYAAAVAGTPWLMIAEIDEAEAYAGVRTIAWATTLLAGLGIAFVYSGGYLLWRRGRQRHEMAALQAERDAEARFRVVFEQAPLGVALLDPRQGRITDANPRLCEILGRSAAELTGLSPQQITHPDDIAEGMDLLRRLNSGQIPGYRLTKRYLRPDGTLVWASLTCAPVRLETDDAPRYLYIVEDITTRRQMEEQLRISEARHRLIADNAIDVIATLDLAGRYTYVSPSVEKLRGFTPEETLRQRQEDVFAGASLTTIQAYFNRLRADLEAGRPIQNFRGELEQRCKDGTTVWTDVSANPLLSPDGSFVEVLGVSRDISEHKRYESRLREAHAAAEAANAAKSEFLAHMSHEIRTPMNAVLGLAQVLEREPLPGNQREMVQRIRSAGQSLLAILNDVLDLSKIEAGQLRLEPRPFELGALLANLDSLMGEAARSKGLALRITPPPLPPGPLVGDGLRLEQILLNLTGNAIKFTEHGEVAVSVHALDGGADGVRLRFEVTDTGIGIAPDALTRLFTPFTQADAGIGRRFGGTGLGLSICKRLVELMGGSIGADSQPGAGSTFHFELPFQRGQAEPGSSATAPAPAAPRGPRLTGAHLLVVDDSAMNRDLVERALALEGATATLAADGQQALECLRNKPDGFDAVLMDVQMPVMDGLTTTRKVRTELGLAGLPIIAFTAGVRDDQQAEARQAGANDVLPKPMDLDQMAALLARWVKPRPQPAAEPAPAESDTFPEIDGIDATRAARRLGGDRAMFIGLLQHFVADNRDAAAETRARLAAGDLEAAARRMHTLRGNAGFICALDLMDSAGELEKAIEAGADATDLDARLDAIGAEIDALVAACAPWL